MQRLCKHLLLALLGDAEHNSPNLITTSLCAFMDPLSAIAVATAVKDIVELGQKIQESFAKVSKNLQDARRVAENIKEMVEEIEVFCEDHKNVIVNMKDFRVALHGLVNQFRSFEASIPPLLPNTNRRKLGVFLRGWWHNNKIREGLSDLEGHIMKVMRSYMMKSAMRAEVKLEAIHQETSRDLTSISQSLDVVRRDVSALRVTTASTTLVPWSYNSLAEAKDDLNRDIIMFASSTASASVPMLRTPNIMTEELVTAAYIRFQVNSIAMTVDSISELHSPALSSAVNFRLSPILEVTSMNTMRLRHHVVRQVTSIRDLLDARHIHTISIDASSRALNNLSVGLETLDMADESIQVGKWAITLARTLFGKSGGGHPDHGAALTLYLLNQSIRCMDSDDTDQSLQAIKEAHTIIQNLRDQCAKYTHLEILHSDVLLQYAELLEDQRSIGMLIEAAKGLEDILEVQAFTQSDMPGEIISRVAQPDSAFLERLLSLAQPVTAVLSYTRALQKLGTYLFRDGHHQDALNLELLAIAVRRKMVGIHGPEYKVELAMDLSSLLRGGSASRIPAEELIDLADECIQLLRGLVETNPLTYVRELVSVLWTKASTLEGLNRGSEAIATWQEVVGLAGQIIQDSEMCATALGNLSDQFHRLERHDDAVRTGTLAITTHHEDAQTQARRYFYLSKDLQQLRRYKESVEAAQSSVTLYQHLAMRDRATWMKYLAASLSHLGHCLAASGDHFEALKTWKDITNMLDIFFDSNNQDASLAIVDMYLGAICIHPLISYILEDEDDCPQITMTTVQYLRQLVEICAQKKSDRTQTMFWAETRHVYNMLRVGRLQDAQHYIDHWLDSWCRKSAAAPELRITRWHTAMISLKVSALDAQGHTKQALLVAQTVDGTSMITHGPTFVELIKSMALKARLQMNLGNSDEALQIAEEALRLSQDKKPVALNSCLVRSWYTIALAALSGHGYNRAIKAAQDGVNFYSNTEQLKKWQNTQSEQDVIMRPGLLAFLSFAEANLGSLSAAIDNARRAVDVSLEIGDMKLYISTITAEHSYMETRRNLAYVMLATGDLSQAQEICKEQWVYLSKRAERRMGEHRDLAPILRMLGVLCCADGRHKDGEAAAQELSHIVKLLGSTFPSLQEQVKSRLRWQAKVPILKVLHDMTQKLECKHQAEVSSLYDI